MLCICAIAPTRSLPPPRDRVSPESSAADNWPNRTASPALIPSTSSEEAVFIYKHCNHRQKTSSFIRKLKLKCFGKAAEAGDIFNLWNRCERTSKLRNLRRTPAANKTIVLTVSFELLPLKYRILCSHPSFPPSHYLHPSAPSSPRSPNRSSDAQRSARFLQTFPRCYRRRHHHQHHFCMLYDD